MRTGRWLWAAGCLLVATTVRAGDPALGPGSQILPPPSPAFGAGVPHPPSVIDNQPPSDPNMPPMPAPPPGAMPEMPASCPVGCISAPLKRHPLWSWVTYQPARRPWLDGHCIGKAPTIVPPLYDYFPCMGRTCPYTPTPVYNPCVGPYPYQCPCAHGFKSLRCDSNKCGPLW
jgi:hypothetical protein